MAKLRYDSSEKVIWRSRGYDGGYCCTIVACHPAARPDASDRRDPAGTSYRQSRASRNLEYMEILQEAVKTAGLSVSVAHRELGAGRPFRGNFLPAQVQDAVLIQQQLVQKHQFILGFDRKPGTASTAFDHD